MRKNTIILICSLFLLFGIVICAKQFFFNESEENMDSYEQISQEEAKNLIDTENNRIILDVRTEAEYDERHIKGAICIPNETLNDTPPEGLQDKNQLILVYCRSGRRSKEASEKLYALGYNNIKEFGGIITWPYDTE